MSLNPDGIDLDSYGAGTGRDDTAAVKKAVADALAAKVPLYLGAATYRVSDTILNAVSVNNITIIGKGIGVSMFRFSPSDQTKPLIRMELCSHPVLKDFSIESSDRKGIGLLLGRYNTAASGDARWNAVTYGRFERIKAYGLYTGIHHDAGWNNDFLSCNTQNCATGLKVHGNALNFHTFLSSLNDTGIDILRGEENSTINFHGGTIEGNGLGMKIRYAHDVNLFGVYFENNPAGHIAAGTDSGDDIVAVNIVGGSLHYPHPVIFDRVKSLNITGLAEHMTPAPLTVTSNVQMANLPAFQQNFGTTSHSEIEAIEITGRNRQSSAPWFVTDFSDLNVPTGSTGAFPLDRRGEITIQPNGATSTLSPYTSDYLSGNKAIRCNLVRNRNYAGLTFAISPTYLPTNTLSAKIPVLLGSTLDSFRIQVTVRYRVQDGSLKSYDPFDYVPAFSGEYGVSKMLGKWMSFIVPIDLASVQALSGFRSLNDIRINLYGTNAQAANGDEWFAVDALELYPTKSITAPHTDSRHLMYRPLELKPATLEADLLVQGGLKTTYASAKPTSGSYNQGDYVRNAKPVKSGNRGSRYVVKGWIRLTTGSNHVLNTDWAEDRSLTGD
ncbi:hypothetical protein [Cohnella caldifontis]|uniref:hypothetical protein n=1 Tax=Cohnella caldifontis TaxID=3027471 RepID=UPI0023EAF49B|nr:hypothetical protein [Cohnella sp. YIM B05605]